MCDLVYSLQNCISILFIPGFLPQSLEYPQIHIKDDKKAKFTIIIIRILIFKEYSQLLGPDSQAGCIYPPVVQFICDPTVEWVLVTYVLYE